MCWCCYLPDGTRWLWNYLWKSKVRSIMPEDSLPTKSNRLLFDSMTIDQPPYRLYRPSPINAAINHSNSVWSSKFDKGLRWKFFLSKNEHVLLEQLPQQYYTNNAFIAQWVVWTSYYEVAKTKIWVTFYEPEKNTQNSSIDPKPLSRRFPLSSCRFA